MLGKGIMYILIGYLILFFVWAIYNLRRYFVLKKYYGKKNAKDKIQNEIKVPVFTPSPKKAVYRNFDRILINSGWRINVRLFYVIKYVVSCSIVIIYLIFTQINTNVLESYIIQDINYGRNQEIEVSKENTITEKILYMQIRDYYKQNQKNLSDSEVMGFIEKASEKMDLSYDTVLNINQRMTFKLQALEKGSSNSKSNINAFILLVLGFLTPNLLARIRVFLINTRKDWEVLNCMTTYSIIGRIPPYKMDLVIDNLLDVTTVYKETIRKFYKALQKKDTAKVDFIISSMDNESMQELLETIVLASEIGIKDTIENIDDMLESKLSYLEIEAKKRRQVKGVISFIPLAIVMLLLFQYLMYGLTMLNQGLLNFTF